MQANAFGNSDAIILPAGHYISSLTLGPTDDSYGDFDILQPVSIQGANADETIISSGISGERVLEINVPRFIDPNYNSLPFEDIRVYFERVSVTNGNTSENGGGILIDTGLVVYFTDSEVANNTAANGGGIWIEKATTFWAADSSIVENTAANSCGGLYVDRLTGVLHAGQVTIADNTAIAGEGGGLCLDEGTSEVSIVMFFVSITGNTAGTTGGGILNRNIHGPYDNQSHRPFFVVGSIIANNSAGISGPNCAFAGSATRALNSVGYNLFDANSCVDAIANDIIAAEPGIGTLAAHSPGHTRTVELLENSPALDILPYAYCGGGIDQRGVERPQGEYCDLGAYERVIPATPGVRVLPYYMSELKEGETWGGGFHVDLSSQPTGTVVVSFDGMSDDVLVTPSEITFDASNWNIKVEVEITAIDDLWVEPTESGVITVTVSGTSAEYANVTHAGIPVTVLDNDVPVISVLSGNPLTVIEGGTASFDISINSEPTGTVIVAFGGIGSDFALSVPSVEFNASNWNDPVTVSVSTTDDGFAEGTKNGAITFTVGGTAPEYAGITLPNLAVTVLDDDSVAVNVVPSVLPLTISEDGTTATFDISLDSEPTGTVTVTFGGAGSDFTLSVPSAEFNATNWDDLVTVTVSAIDDTDAEGTENTAITFTVSGTAAEYSGVTHGNLPVKITDNDAALVTEDLITNGGWETGGVSAWKYTSTLAKRQCKGTGNGSNCALLLKPGLPVAMAYQDVPAALVPFEAGETLHFEFAAKIGGTAKLVAMLKLKYVGGTTGKLKVKPVPINTGSAWVTQSLDHSDATLLNVKAIRVLFRHNGATGKIRVDDAVLQRLSNAILPRGEVIPLLEPPEGFRGEN